MTLVYDFTYDGGGLHKGGTGVLMINGKKVGEGRIEKTMGVALFPGCRNGGYRQGRLLAGDQGLRSLGQRVHRHDQEGDHRAQGSQEVAGCGTYAVPDFEELKE